MSLTDDLDACLPQTQCRSCEFDDCLDYARAIANDQAEINRCPPGGDTTLDLLSALTGKPRGEIDTSLKPHHGYRVARIVETECIGCAKCIKACPVDAIVGSGKRMHTVLPSHCTGCELCLPPCPVDCIVLERPASTSRGPWVEFDASMADRFRKLRQRRKAREYETKSEPVADTAEVQIKQTMKAEIMAAVARARQKRNNAAKIDG